MNKILLLFILNCVTINAFSSPGTKTAWVDSVYQRLTLDERIGQLFMVQAFSGHLLSNQERVLNLIKAGQVGSVLFMQGTPQRQAMLTNEFQQAAKVPLLVATDAEWGLAMRLDSVRELPLPMTVGATCDSMLAYKEGAIIASQCKRIGVHLNFAPDADLAYNPGNSTVGFRSYGADKNTVAMLTTAYMKGLQDNGVMACAKHFPGHCNSETDSHRDQPVVGKSFADLDTTDLYPYKELIANGLSGIMTGHVSVPALESGVHVAATLSHSILTELLREQMGFTGLIFTDALNMLSLSKYFERGDMEVRAFLAGNDVLVFSQDIPFAIGKIKEAIAAGKINKQELEARVKKILAAKYDAGLVSWQAIDTSNLIADLNKGIEEIKKEASEKSVTIYCDDTKLLSKIANAKKINYVGVNLKENSVLQKKLSEEFPDMPISWLPKGSNKGLVNQLVNRIDKSDITIVGVHNLSSYQYYNYGIDLEEMNFLKAILKKKNVLLVFFGNTYALEHIGKPESVLISFEDNPWSEKVAADIILGRSKPRGKLPLIPCLKTMP